MNPPTTHHHVHTHTLGQVVQLHFTCAVAWKVVQFSNIRATNSVIAQYEVAQVSQLVQAVIHAQTSCASFVLRQSSYATFDFDRPICATVEFSEAVLWQVLCFFKKYETSRWCINLATCSLHYADHDNAQLLSGEDFASQVVGYAAVKVICISWVRYKLGSRLLLWFSHFTQYVL